MPRDSARHSRPAARRPTRAERRAEEEGRMRKKGALALETKHISGQRPRSHAPLGTRAPTHPAPPQTGGRAAPTR
eukprot:9500806-Pyramimonas_sp.AAC.1